MVNSSPPASSFPSGDLETMGEDRRSAGEPLEPAAERRVRVLLVDDHWATAQIILEGLKQHGYDVATVASTKAARQQLEAERPDILILDRFLPDSPGLQFCSELHRTAAVPIIMISGAGSATDRIDGLDAGADDYLAKPLHVAELRARIEAVLRRAGSSSSSPTICGPYDLELNLRANDVVRGDQHVQLTRSETALLRLFLEHPGTVWTTDELSQRIWGYETAGDPNFVQLHVSRLRRKLSLIGVPKDFIRTVYGVGYASGASSRDASDL